MLRPAAPARPTPARPGAAAPQARTATEVEQFETDAAVHVLRAMLIEGKRHRRR